MQEQNDLDERAALMDSIAKKLEKASTEELKDVYMWLFGFLTKVAGAPPKE